MRRWFWVPAVLLVAAAGVALAYPVLSRVKAPIKIGILHSLTGPLAISERSMREAEALAIEELNSAGGLLGRRVEAVVADGRSDPATFAREAERLVSEEKVSVIFGCWTSACRKSVRSVVERMNQILIYPVAYEGLEQSPQIFYTGAAPNQQVIPSVKWARDILKAKTFYLVGTDSIWPRAVNAIIKDQLKALGAELIGEEYVEADRNDMMESVVGKLVNAKPDIILNTLEGDANKSFYDWLRGKKASKVPSITFAVAEDELRELNPKQMTNDYAVCNYFQAIDSPENIDFVRRFKAKYGADRVTSDSIATAYNSVKLWAQAVTEAETDRIEEVRDALRKQSLNAPEGVISISRDSQHTWRPFFVGRIRSDGQVDIVLTLTKPIRPTPFPFSRTREEWESYLASLQDGWGGNWAPTPGRGGGR